MDLLQIFVLTIGLFSLVTNGVLLYILLRDPLKCFKASTTYFIISLAFSDLLTGTNACFFGLSETLALTEDQKNYLLSLFWITTQASFLTLLAMSVERFLIVKYPIYCRVWITKKRVSLSIACIWSVSATLGGLVLLPPPHINYVQFSIFCEFFLSVFLITGLYTLILFGIRSSQKNVKGTGQLHKGGSGRSIRKTSTGKKDTYGIQITITEDPDSSLSRALVPVNSGSPLIVKQHSNGTTNNGALGEELVNGNKHPVDQNPEAKKNAHTAKTREKSVVNCSKARRNFIKAAQNIGRRKEKTGASQQDKLTAVVLLLVGILALTVLPYLLASQILIGYSIFCNCPPPESLILFVQYYFPIELLNFAVNPLVYAWRLPQYRRSLRYLCSKYQPNTEASQAWASVRSGSIRLRREYTSQ